LGIRQRIDLVLARLHIELADEAAPIAAVPDVAVLVVYQAVRAAQNRDRIFLHLAGLGIEPAEPVGELARPPQRAVGRRQRIMRARAGRRRVPLMELDLDRAGDHDRLWPRLFRKARDQVALDLAGLLLADRRTRI